MSKLEKIKELVSKIKMEDDKFYNSDYNSDSLKFHKIHREIREKLEYELRELGIEFQCEDYGDSYCLNARGLEVVLKAIE